VDWIRTEVGTGAGVAPGAQTEAGALAPTPCAASKMGGAVEAGSYAPRLRPASGAIEFASCGGSWTGGATAMDLGALTLRFASGAIDPPP
jgi:hypothetical protein